MSEQYQGRVLRATRATYEVMVGDKVLQCTIRGKLMNEDPDYRSVRVGDFVTVSLVNDHEGIIENILPRSSQIERNIESRQYQKHIIAVNVDQMLILLSTKQPPFKSGFLDRYLVVAEKHQIPPIICLNKIDLGDKADFEPYRQYYQNQLKYPFFYTSATNGEGLEELKNYLKDKTTVIVGQSGVGKSSLIKAIQPHLDIRIAEVSERTNKGQHTTTHSQLYPLDFGGFIMDTPGIRELGLWGVYKENLAQYFVDFAAISEACQFADCTHIHEPGCAVKAAIGDNPVLRERYQNYCNIYHSLSSSDQKYHYR